MTFYSLFKIGVFLTLNMTVTIFVFNLFNALFLKSV